MKIDIIVGARPNFMKIAPIIEAIEAVQKKGNRISYRLIHTGQHYDKNMSDSFFEQLGIPEPEINLGAGGGTQAEQTANIMVGYEKILMDSSSDLCLVVGDVNSTMACAVTAKKLRIKVAHVEAGIRSGDLTMPEEINRMVTDSITDYFYTTTRQANQNLYTLGVDANNVIFVGNTMIDTLLKNLSRLRKPKVWEDASLQTQEYIVVTLHRPANVDEENNLKSLINEIVTNVRGIPVIFPVHPRTKQRLNELGVVFENMYLTDPMGYLEFNYLVKNSKAVITDSGGITEETTVMEVPCMTLRDNTERPETCTIGTNELLGTDSRMIKPALDKLFEGKWKKGAIPENWDGKAAIRIVDHFIELESNLFKSL